MGGKCKWATTNNGSDDVPVATAVVYRYGHGTQARVFSRRSSPSLVWFITGAGKCHYVCVVGTAPQQRHPHVPIFAAGSGFEL
jgi:hypothetical protein